MKGSALLHNFRAQKEKDVVIFGVFSLLCVCLHFYICKAKDIFRDKQTSEVGK